MGIYTKKISQEECRYKLAYLLNIFLFLFYLLLLLLQLLSLLLLLLQLLLPLILNYYYRLGRSNVSTCAVMTPRVSGGTQGRNRPWTALPVAVET